MTDVLATTDTPPDLSAEAERQNQIARNQDMIYVLRAWKEEDVTLDPVVQAAEWEALKAAIDEDRLSYRSRFREEEAR